MRHNGHRMTHKVDSDTAPEKNRKNVRTIRVRRTYLIQGPTAVTVESSLGQGLYMCLANEKVGTSVVVPSRSFDEPCRHGTVVEPVVPLADVRTEARGRRRRFLHRNRPGHGVHDDARRVGAIVLAS